MIGPDPNDLQALLTDIHVKAQSGNLRIALHAHQEMVEETITLDETLQTIGTGQIIENYPQHRRGARCLLNGVTQAGRPLHVVCTTTQPALIIITVYEPKLPKWVTPTQRGR